MSLTSKLDLTDIDAVLKVRYNPQRLDFLGYKESPLFSMFAKDPNAKGKYTVVPFYFGQDQGRGVTIALAQGNQSDHRSDDMQITLANNYAVHDIDAKAMAASASDMFSFLQSEAMAMDECVQNLVADLANDCFRDGSGTRGRVSAYSAGGGGAESGDEVITLTTAGDVVNFEIGMIVKWTTSAVNSFSAVDAGQFRIDKIDRTAGTLTGLRTVSGGSDPASGNFLTVLGDAAATSAAAVKMRGLDAWLPAVAPTTGDSFFGMDRSPDPVRLAGIRFNGSGLTAKEAIIEAGTIAFREQARPDVVIMNPAHRADIAKDLQQQAIYDPVRSPDGRVYFDALRIEAGCGLVRVVADAHCPIGVAYMLQLDTWKLLSLGPVPHLVNEDGLSILRKATDDAYEVRFRAWPQLLCTKPGKNVRITLDAT